MTDFWSKRLGGTARPSGAPTAPAALPPQFRSVSAPSPAPEPHAAPAAPRKAASARQTDLCPGCGSGNYLAPPGGRARCYDCGYPIEQSTSGVASTTSQGGTATPAPQAAGYSGGFQPSVIVNK